MGVSRIADSFQLAIPLILAIWVIRLNHAVVPSHPRGMFYVVCHCSSMSKYSQKLWVCYEGGHRGSVKDVAFLI